MKTFTCCCTEYAHTLLYLTITQKTSDVNPSQLKKVKLARTPMEMLPITPYNLCQRQENRSIFLRFFQRQQQFHPVLEGERVSGKSAGGEGGKVGLQQGEHV